MFAETSTTVEAQGHDSGLLAAGKAHSRFYAPIATPVLSTIRASVSPVTARGTLVGCVIATVCAVASGCGGVPKKDFDGETLAVGDSLVELYDPGADRPISVYVPSGVLTLGIETPGTYVDDGSEYTFDDIAASKGAELIGIEWELDDLHVYPTDVGEALTVTPQNDLSAQAMSGGLGLVKAAVVADGDRTDMIGDETSLKHGHTVVGIPKGSTPSLEVEYDGETQAVNLLTGTVERGKAEPLSALAGQPSIGKKDWMFTDRVECGHEDGPARSQVRFFCNSSPALELPYVRGLGWAEVGTPFVLADVYLSADSLGSDRVDTTGLVVTLDNARSLKEIEPGFGNGRVFQVKSSPQHEVRIHGSLDPKSPGLVVDENLQIPTWRLK